jgi:hypothetical protein
MGGLEINVGLVVRSKSGRRAGPAHLESEHEPLTWTIRTYLDDDMGSISFIQDYYLNAWFIWRGHEVFVLHSFSLSMTRASIGHRAQ